MNRSMNILLTLLTMSILGLGLAAIYNEGVVLIESGESSILIDGRR
ncbi:MAG: hypothetical protein AAGA83_17885 [Cyanobacteria bacterium P01_F01_bin.116]